VSRSAGTVAHEPAVSERAFPAGQASVRRVQWRGMRDVHPRQWWKTKRRGGQRVRIRSVHRKERRVDVVDETGKRFQLTAAELRRFYQQADEAPTS
jgi:hypothetical protein